jgi:AraC-like DNA-binding protein
VRTLRRRLEEEGTSYRALSQAKLYEAALSLLRQPEASVHSVSHALGFSDPSAFHRAFRRWSKSTPMDFRSGRLEASH